MVKIEILEETENHVSLLLKETDRAFANAMRRTLMSNVPKMAIHRVRFELGTITDSQTGETYESIGALPDEVIAHRLATRDYLAKNGEPQRARLSITAAHVVHLRDILSLPEISMF